MDDIAGQVMLSTGDENFGAGNLVAAVRLRLSAGAHDAEVGAGVSLGQGHRTGPLPAVELRQVGGFLRRRAMGIDTQAGTHRKRAIEIQTGVGSLQHFLDEAGQHLRHPLAAEFRVPRQA